MKNKNVKIKNDELKVGTGMTFDTFEEAIKSIQREFYTKKL